MYLLLRDRFACLEVGPLQVGSVCRPLQLKCNGQTFDSYTISMCNVRFTKCRCNRIFYFVVLSFPRQTVMFHLCLHDTTANHRAGILLRLTKKKNLKISREKIPAFWCDFFVVSCRTGINRPSAP